jgi:molybdopterin converting factor small subunit
MRQVRILYFSVLQDITGKAEETRALPAESKTVRELLDLLFGEWSELRRWEPSLLIAVDQAFAKPGDLLPEGDCEVALMPPVQGG